MLGIRRRLSREASSASLAAVLALPFLLLTANSSWIYTYPETVDGWVYFGYFEHPRTYLEAYAGTYYGTRLSWILPGAAAHRLFDPIVANFVLHLAVYYIAIVAVYATLKRTVGGRAALVGSILMGTYSYFLFAVGWNYVDGAGVAYYAVALWAVTAAAYSVTRWPARFLAGAALAGSIHTNVLWMVMGVPFVYYAVRSAWLHADRRIPFALAPIALGFVMVTVALGLANVWLGSQFLFFKPSLDFVVYSAVRPNPFGDASFTWLPDADWLLFPAVAVVMALGGVVRGLRAGEREAYPLREHFVCACAVFLILELAGRTVLQHPFTVSFLIPAMALSVGSQLAPILKALTPGEYVRVSVLTLLAGVLAFAPALGSRIFNFVGPMGLWAPLIVVTVPLALLLVFQKTWALMAFVLSVTIANVATVDGRPFDFSRRPVRQEKFRAVVEAADVLDEVDPGAGARFWYKGSSPLGDVYLAVSSTRLWGYRLVGTHFPSLWSPITLRNSPVAAGDRIVILDEGPMARELADAALKPLNLAVRPLAARAIDEGAVRFTLMLVEAVPRK